MTTLNESRDLNTKPRQPSLTIYEGSRVDGLTPCSKLSAVGVKSLTNSGNLRTHFIQIHWFVLEPIESRSSRLGLKRKLGTNKSEMQHVKLKRKVCFNLVSRISHFPAPSRRGCLRSLLWLSNNDKCEDRFFGCWDTSELVEKGSKDYRRNSFGEYQLAFGNENSSRFLSNKGSIETIKEISSGLHIMKISARVALEMSTGVKWKLFILWIPLFTFIELNMIVCLPCCPCTIFTALKLRIANLN